MTHSKIFIFIALLAIPFVSYSQNKGKEQPSSIQGTNVLDMQTNLYKDFILDSAANPNGIHDFIDLVNQSELTPEQKKQAKDFYNSYTRQGNPQKQDSLQQVVLRMIKEAEKPAKAKPINR